VNHADHLSGWIDLQGEFRRRGYFAPNTRRIAAELAFHLTLLVGGMALFLCFGAGWLGQLGIIASAAGSLGVSTNTHAASHGGAYRSARANRALTYFGYPFTLGLSATYWWHKHCAVHHPNPNIVGVDDDIDFMPFFALNSDELDRSGSAARFYYRYQWLVAPFAISLNSFNMQRQGWVFLIRRLARPTGSRIPALIDLACLSAHLGLYLVLPALLFSPGAAVACYVLRSVVLSYGVFSLFAPGHFPEEAACAKRQPRDVDFVVRQTLTTANFRLGPIARLFASGLQFQIEHHLFPRIDHTRYPAMSREVRAFCERHALPYHCLGWGEALRKSFVPFYRPKQVVARLVPPVPPTPRALAEQSA
jgi:linoleoyl-CoA desaturase